MRSLAPVLRARGASSASAICVTIIMAKHQPSSFASNGISRLAGNLNQQLSNQPISKHTRRKLLRERQTTAASRVSNLRHT